MDRKALLETVKLYADLVFEDFTAKQVILYGAWLEGLAREDDEIEVAVVFDRLKEDMLETRGKLQVLGQQVDPRIEPTIIELNKKDIVGFYKEVLENGHIAREA